MGLFYKKVFRRVQQRYVHKETAEEKKYFIKIVKTDILPNACLYNKKSAFNVIEC